ncbi:TetR/AcrR family transcriptional regulator [Mycobacteroides chelonae]|uniref:TetR/AcrR family transcriptional regulator n=2 Tax=Mycobacteroides chelonae TaxID=1774 RepID=UPI0013F4D427|nr:TetR/AcrR family transcriptional regulator [Mycobacteroides chelonae]
MSGSDNIVQLTSNPADEGAEELTERILAAAKLEFELIGIRRSSMGDVARRAGIARATLYRRFPGKDNLVQAVATRELLTVMSRLVACLSLTNSGEDTVVQLAVASARELRTNPLLNRLLTTEPEELYHYAANSGGPALEVARGFLLQYLQPMHDLRLVPEQQLSRAAEIMIRLAVTQLLIPDGVVPFHDDYEMSLFARQFLAPMVATNSSDGTHTT